MQVQNESNIWDELARPFSPDEIGLRIIATTKDKSRGLVAPYIDARSVMERLDEVVGIEGWHDHYEVLGPANGRVSVRCCLTIAGQTKEDAGEGDDYKAACSDALKRAAVKFKIGRHLYRAQKPWARLDPKGRVQDEVEVKHRVVLSSLPDPPPMRMNVDSSGNGSENVSGDGTRDHLPKPEF